MVHPLRGSRRGRLPPQHGCSSYHWVSGWGLRGWRLKAIIAAGAGLTLGIETIQAVVLSGRDPSLGDLLANTGGVWIGGVLGQAWSMWLVPNPVVARRLTTAVIGLWLAVQLFTAWALQPSAPRGKYFGQWQPELQGMGVFGGLVLEASLNRLPLPQGPAEQSGEFQQEARDRVSRLTTVILSGIPTPRRAPIVAVAHAKKYHVVSLAQEGPRHRSTTDGSGRAMCGCAPHRSNCATVSPKWRGDSVRIVGLRDGNTMSIVAEHDGVSQTIGIALSPNMGWTLLDPFDQAIGRKGIALGNALWLASWLAIVGWWSSFAFRRTELKTAWFMGAMVLGHLVIPLATGYQIGTGPEWAAGAMGWLAGLMAGGRTRRSLKTQSDAPSSGHQTI